MAQTQAGQTAPQSSPTPQWGRSDMAALMGEIAQHRREVEAGVRHSKWSDTGTYVRSADGDTLAVKTSQHGLITVRVAGVDAPERDMRFAEDSTRFLRSFVRGATLKLDCRTIDRFGRHVCEVRKGDQDLGASLVGAGLAWHFKRYAHEQSPANRELYAKLENEARAKRLGLWADLDAMKPEACRHFKREGLGCN
jgi:endonuclease YncB( thermonuclease family)